MSGHTPGPWLAQEDTSSLLNDDWMIGRPDGPPDEIAVCSERDAHLIAAAPDLLEALQHVMRCIPMGGFAQIHHGSSTWEQIDAAIAKATGQGASK